MKRILVLFSFLFCFCVLHAQEHSCPVEHVEQYAFPSNPDSAEENFETCFGCDWQSFKTIRLVFHVIRNEDGQYNFSPGEEFLLQGIVDVANKKLGDNQPPTQPAFPNQPVPEINFRYELAEIRYYDEVNWAYPNIDYPTLDPDLLDIFLVEQSGDWFGNGCGDSNFCTGVFCCAGGWAGGGLNNRAVLNRAYFRYVFEDLQPNCYDIFDGDADAAWTSTYADVLIHEIGHLTGLSHLNINDGCDDTPLLSNVCSSNNFMSGCACNKGSFTCCQIERMHAAFESGSFPFVIEEERSCEASFITFPQECEYFFFNNSQSPGVEDFTTTWCVKELGEPANSGIREYETFNLEFPPPCNGDFRICLQIQTPDGCIDVHCEEINVECTECECQPGPDPCAKDYPNDGDVSFTNNEKGSSISSFLISPNPASTNIAIDISTLDLSQTHTLEIYDLLGNIVHRDFIDKYNSQKEIDTSNFQNGIFIVQITSATNKRYVQELVITH